MSRMTRLIVIFAGAVMSLIGLLHLTLQPAYAGGSVTNCSNDTDFTNVLSTGGLVTFNCGGPATIKERRGRRLAR